MKIVSARKLSVTATSGGTYLAHELLDAVEVLEAELFRAVLDKVDEVEDDPVRIHLIQVPVTSQSKSVSRRNGGYGFS